jgi:hypothetical protein
VLNHPITGKRLLLVLVALPLVTIVLAAVVLLLERLTA